MKSIRIVLAKSPVEKQNRKVTLKNYLLSIRGSIPIALRSPRKLKRCSGGIDPRGRKGGEAVAEVRPATGAIGIVEAGAVTRCFHALYLTTGQLN